MTNGVHGDAELGGTVYEATASANGLLSFRLADGPCAAYVRSGIAQGWSGEPVAPRRRSGAPKKANS
jgi:hypothetical protein